MDDGKRRNNGGVEVLRADIDSSKGILSVREAASRFGGMGFWKPKSPEFSPESMESVDIYRLKEQTAQLENDLLLKEKETLDVLKQLNSTKLVIHELKTKLEKEDNTRIVSDMVDQDVGPVLEESYRENCFTNPNAVAPGQILMELKQAKLNIIKNTTELAHVRASVASLVDKLEKEKTLLEKSRERLTHNCSRVSYLEGELKKQTTMRLLLAKDGPPQLHQLSSEAEIFKKVGEAAKSEVQRRVSEIEQAKTQIKVVETRLAAALKVKEEAQAAKIKALSNHKLELVTLTYEEYASLIRKSKEAEALSNKRVMEAMLRVDEANMSKAEVLKRLQESIVEVKTRKKVLEEVSTRIETANKGKLAAEESLRHWKSVRKTRKSSSTKFKNSSSSRRRRRDSFLADNRVKPSSKQTLSIGQILSQKLKLAKEFQSSRKVAAKHSLKRKKVSLREMLSKPNDDDKFEMKTHYKHHHDHQKQLSTRRKKFGFERLSLVWAKHKKRKKTVWCDLR